MMCRTVVDSFSHSTNTWTCATWVEAHWTNDALFQLPGWFLDFVFARDQRPTLQITRGSKCHQRGGHWEVLAQDCATGKLRQIGVQLNRISYNIVCMMQRHAPNPKASQDGWWQHERAQTIRRHSATKHALGERQRVNTNAGMSKTIQQKHL